MTETPGKDTAADFTFCLVFSYTESKPSDLFSITLLDSALLLRSDGSSAQPKTIFTFASCLSLPPFLTAFHSASVPQK